MIKVLHVINWFRRGGVETQLLQILRGYNQTRFHMDVGCYGNEIGYLASDAEKLDAKVLHFPKSANLFSLSKRFCALIKNRDYDIVHCHSEAWSGPILRGAKYAGVPVRLAHIRSSLPQGFKIRNPILKLGRNFIMLWGRHWLLKYATHILGVSKSSLDARFPKRNNDNRFLLWTLGVDTERFCPAAREGGSGGERGVIINVGSFIPQRRQDLGIEIFRKVNHKMPGTSLVLVGEGESLQTCRALASKSGTAGGVDFLGLQEDIPGLLDNADIFLSCSEAEGLPNVLIEAQASGLPVVASDIPPHREALHDTSHRFLFQHDDIQGAADSIVKVINDLALYDELSRAGRQFAVEHYNAQINLKRLEEMYLRWVSEKKG